MENNDINESKQYYSLIIFFLFCKANRIESINKTIANKERITNRKLGGNSNKLIVNLKNIDNVNFAAICVNFTNHS